MAEYIEREAVTAAILNLKSALNTGIARRNLTQKDIMRVIAEFPAGDVVPVVRCKECKHMNIVGVGYRWCKVWERIQTMGDDGYCCFGERMGDDG